MYACLAWRKYKLHLAVVQCRAPANQPFFESWILGVALLTKQMNKPCFYIHARGAEHTAGAHQAQAAAWATSALCNCFISFWISRRSSLPPRTCGLLFWQCTIVLLVGVPVIKQCADYSGSSTAQVPMDRVRHGENWILPRTGLKVITCSGQLCLVKSKLLL